MKENLMEFWAAEKRR